ncbi:MAG: sensor histidine kinase [Cyanobacteria bacterium J06632_3]
MNRAIQLQNHPFRFLLYLEWGLLVVAMMSALEAPPIRPLRRAVRDAVRQGGPLADVHYNPLIAVVPIVLFGLMGLYLPANRWAKIGHTMGQFALIVVSSATVVNEGRTFPFIYLVAAIRGCLMYNLPGRILVTGSAFLLFASGLVVRLRSFSDMGRRLPPPIQDRLRGFFMSLQLNFIVLFGLSLLLVVLLINALINERQSQKRLQQANQDLRQSAQEIEKLAMDQERSRIARDIHDDLGHSLTALNIQLESAVKLWEKDPLQAHQFLTTAKQLGTQSLQAVRQSVAKLRQDPLAGNDLKTAIAQLLQTLSNSQLTVHSSITLNHPLSTNLNILLYRVIQEGLTNIVKHANATQIHLTLTNSPAIVTLILEDNGTGFDLSKARTGFGLQSMRDRTESVGGTFTVTSKQSDLTKEIHKGTRLQISLPTTPRYQATQ